MTGASFICGRLMSTGLDDLTFGVVEKIRLGNANEIRSSSEKIRGLYHNGVDMSLIDV